MKGAANELAGGKGSKRTMRGGMVLLGALALGCGDRPALGPAEMATSNQTRFNLTVEEFASIPDNFTVDRIVTRFSERGSHVPR